MATPSTRAGRGATSKPSLAGYYVTACVRCHQKKKRCDQKLPRCSLCEVADAECINYDAVARRRVPRSYILDLEERVAHLEKRLHDRGIDDSSNRRDAAVDTVLSLAQSRQADEPALSKVLLSELIKSKMAPRISAVERLPPLDMPSDLDTSPVTLPAEESAQKLVDAYFQFANLGMPLLHEGTFRKKLRLLYDMSPVVDLANVHTSTSARMAVFFVLEVFAVALLTMQKQDPSRVPTSLADRYHTTGLRALSEAGLPSDVEGVQALLLAGQYSYHHPTTWAVWRTIGAALRLAVELGLHRDASSDDADVLTLDTMRRTFWVAYSMDRNVSIALGMPSCLSDGAITAKFPSLLNDEHITVDGATANEADGSFWPKSISFHLFRYRLIQSEMQTVLYDKPPPGCYERDLSRWQQDMHDKIYAWRSSTPHNDNLSVYQQRTVGNFELTFHRALLYLYQPSPNIPAPSQAGFLAIKDAATNVIQLYRRLFLQRTLTIYWQAVENLSSAGTALMFSYVNCPQVQEQLTFRALESMVRMCSSVLWGMVEHFPAFKGKRDAFDIAASKTLADLADDDTPAPREQLQTLVGDPAYQPDEFMQPQPAIPETQVLDAPFLLTDLDGMSFEVPGGNVFTSSWM